MLLSFVYFAQILAQAMSTGHSQSRHPPKDAGRCEVRRMSQDSQGSVVCRSNSEGEYNCISNLFSKEPSKDVNIFMSVQNVHFFRLLTPSHPSVQTNIFGFQNMGFMHNIYCATTKINPSFKPV